jgi:7-cyano-7-deazaguanine synthase
MDRRAVCIVSGGLDSSVLAYRYRDLGFDLSLVSFDYGQRHHKELRYAEKLADRLDVEWHPIVLQDLADFLGVYSESVLVNTSHEVPEGHYAEDTMRQTVVPNRNMVMLAIAGSVAVAKAADVLATGVHAGDHFIYPDCRPGFIDAMGRALVLGNEGFGSDEFRLEAPFVNMSKAAIVSLGAELVVPFEKTWSCYFGGDIHCGKCGTCVERIEAFMLAGVYDPTTYEDTEFAKEVTA